VKAEILEIKDMEQYKSLKTNALDGKIAFFNFHFPQELINTFDGYGVAGPYRWTGPSLASAKGAVGVIIRSVSSGADDFPHTGSSRITDTLRQIPAMAIGNATADSLERAIAKASVVADMYSEARFAEDKQSFNVIAELRGSKHPNEILLAGGHLDSWDVGEGAHDDGAGVVQCIELIKTISSLGIRPSHTIRVVLFMNEENGLAGGTEYGAKAAATTQKHLFAIETDAGGFSPRGFGFVVDSIQRLHIKQFSSLFLPYGIYDFDQEEGGADLSALKKQGVPVGGLLPDPQRYFDLHHTNADVFEAVNHRELKLGAVAITQLLYLLDRYPLPEAKVKTEVH
jgi:hypothetical protein